MLHEIILMTVRLLKKPWPVWWFLEKQTDSERYFYFFVVIWLEIAKLNLCSGWNTCDKILFCCDLHRSLKFILRGKTEKSLIAVLTDFMKNFVQNLLLWFTFYPSFSWLQCMKFLHSLRYIKNDIEKIKLSIFKSFCRFVSPCTGTHRSFVNIYI